MIEIYDRDRHFETVRSWGGPADPRDLGLGLFEPGVACLFFGRIDGTRSLYLHTARTNHEASALARTRSLQKMLAQAIEHGRFAGFAGFIADTDNRVCERIMVEKQGFQSTDRRVVTRFD